MRVPTYMQSPSQAAKPITKKRGLTGISRIVVAKDDDPLCLGWRLPRSQHPGIHGGPTGNTEERRSREGGFDALRNSKRVSGRRKPDSRTFCDAARHQSSG
jgi:hypothetical protein